MRDAYYEWMLDKIGGARKDGRSYKMMLSCLRDAEYTYIVPMDANRYEDGIDLRYRFAYEKGLNQAEVLDADLYPCSIFEMLLAIALRVEDNIMSDTEYGNRTSIWFWEFIRNLGLLQADDIHFDNGYVSSVLRGFLNREYEADGHGSIVRISDPRKDCRPAELWMQVMWYFNEKA